MMPKRAHDQALLRDLTARLDRLERWFQRERGREYNGRKLKAQFDNHLDTIASLRRAAAGRVQAALDSCEQFEPWEELIGEEEYHDLLQFKIDDEARRQKAPKVSAKVRQQERDQRAAECKKIFARLKAMDYVMV
ncbi:MAG: hypothetical protein WA814_03520 [Candidatus Baltobacteraceae bacterium]